MHQQPAIELFADGFLRMRYHDDPGTADFVLKCGLAFLPETTITDRVRRHMKWVVRVV